MKSKSVPNLPASSRMKSPTSGGTKTTGIIKEKGGMAKKGASVTKKVMAAAKGKSVKPKY